MNEHRFNGHLSSGQAAVADQPGVSAAPRSSGNGTPAGAGPVAPSQASAPGGDAGRTRRADAAPLASGDREDNGRFAKGNPGGPGNPFAREVAAMRRAFMNRVSARDLEDIADKMVALAKDGNVQAAKFIFSYMIGKPLPSRDPDHLNEHESEVFMGESKITQEAATYLNKPEPEVSLMLAREMRSEMTRQAYAHVDAKFYYSLPEHLRKLNPPDKKKLQTWKELRLVPPSAKRKSNKALKRR
jgi:hypothetical protein